MKIHSVITENETSTLFLEVIMGGNHRYMPQTYAIGTFNAVCDTGEFNINNLQETTEE